MVYQILRRQSGAQPEIRRHDEQNFENSPFKSTFREWVDGKQVGYLGEYMMHHVGANVVVQGIKHAVILVHGG